MPLDYAEYEKQGLDILGIKFVPLRIPLQRRWEMFCLLLSNMCGIYILPLVVPMLWPFIYLVIYTNFRYVVVLYVCWYIYDRNTPYKGGRSSRMSLLGSVLTTIPKYFPSTLVKTVNLPANTNYLFGAFPHGIVAHGVQMNFALSQQFQQLFPGLERQIISLPTFFKFPILRESFLLNGVSASNRENILYHLTSKEKYKAVIIVVGGVAESLLTESGTNRIIINNRKGFVKLAIKSGSPLVPVYTFGENDVLEQYQGKRIRKFQDFIRKYTGIPPFLLKGRGIFQYTFGMLPHRRPLITIVGKPIIVPKIENPSDELVGEYHSKFKEALIELFEANKEKYDIKGKDAQLICL